MPGPLALALPLILAAVFLTSGIAKLRTPDDLAGWTAMGVPAVFRRPWLVRLHPWGELALAVALIVFGGVLGVLAALVAVVLMVAYLWLVVRAVRTPEDTSCSCFGSRRRVTRVTVVRNVWLTVLAVATAVAIGTLPLVGGALAALVADPAAVALWLVVVLVATVTTALILWPEAETQDVSTLPEAAAPASLPADGDDLEYVRVRTPAVPVTLADGTVVNLRKLAQTKPILLMALSSTCGTCEPVREQIPEWRRLLPEVDIRVLLMEAPETSTWTESEEPQSLHDPHQYVRGSIADWSTPTAVLLGIDGLLAGGPETGVDAVPAFVADIYESLHGVRPPAF